MTTNYKLLSLCSLVWLLRIQFKMERERRKIHKKMHPTSSDYCFGWLTIVFELFSFVLFTNEISFIFDIHKNAIKRQKMIIGYYMVSEWKREGNRQRQRNGESERESRIWFGVVGMTCVMAHAERLGTRKLNSVHVQTNICWRWCCCRCCCCRYLCSFFFLSSFSENPFKIICLPIAMEMPNGEWTTPVRTFEHFVTTNNRGETR